MRFQVSKDNEFLHHQFEYTRSRLRIARASALNFAITTLLAEVFVMRWLRGSPVYTSLVVFIGLAGGLLSGLGVYTWHKLVRSYFGVISANYRLQLGQERTKPEGAAAGGPPAAGANEPKKAAGGKPKRAAP